MTTEEKIKLSENPDTAIEIFNELAEDENWEVRYNLTKNPNIPSDILGYLSKDKIIKIRAQVARNINTPRKTLRKLKFEDESMYIRYVASKNPKAPPSTWELLMTVYPQNEAQE